MIKRIAAICLLPLLAAEVFTWTTLTYRAIADEALRLTAPELVSIVGEHRDLLVKSATQGLKEHGKSADHYYYPRQAKGGALDALDSAIKEGTEIVRKGRSAKALAKQMGIICHFASDLANPLFSSDEDPRGAIIEDNFARYTEMSLAKFRISFSGYRGGFFTAEDTKPFFERSSVRSYQRYGILVNAFYAGDDLRDYKTFDDRSTAFGVASVSFSLAVSNTAKAWNYFWYTAGGDIKGTPFLKTREAD